MKRRKRRIEIPKIARAKMRRRQIKKGEEAENTNSIRIEDINKVYVKNNEVVI